MATDRPGSRPPLAAKRNRVVDVDEEGGKLELFLPSPTLCVCVVSGHLSSAMVAQWIAHFAPLFERGLAFHTFLDWEKLTSYDSGARRDLTSWVVGHIRNVSSAHFLVSSRLVAMGVSAANLATTLAGLSMTSHTSRASFERALAETLRSAEESAKG